MKDTDKKEAASGQDDDFLVGFGLDKEWPEYEPPRTERFRKKVESICGPVLLILGTIGVALVMVQAFLIVLK